MKQTIPFKRTVNCYWQNLMKIKLILRNVIQKDQIMSDSLHNSWMNIFITPSKLLQIMSTKIDSISGCSIVFLLLKKIMKNLREKFGLICFNVTNRYFNLCKVLIKDSGFKNNRVIRFMVLITIKWDSMWVKSLMR